MKKQKLRMSKKSGNNERRSKRQKEKQAKRVTESLLTLVTDSLSETKIPTLVLRRSLEFQQIQNNLPFQFLLVQPHCNFYS